jgi:hypothetical protein
VLQLAYDDKGNRVPDRSTSDIAASFFFELVQDNNGKTKPTALHFTAGQQPFLRW